MENDMKKFLFTTFALIVGATPLAAREEKKQQITIGPDARIRGDVIIQGNRRGQPNVNIHPNAKIGGNLIQLDRFGRPIEGDLTSRDMLGSAKSRINNDPSEIDDNGTNVPQDCIKENTSLEDRINFGQNIFPSQIPRYGSLNPLSLATEPCPTGYKREGRDFTPPPLTYAKFPTNSVPIYCLVKDGRISGNVHSSCEPKIMWGNATEVNNPYRFRQEFSDRASLYCIHGIAQATTEYLAKQALSGDLVRNGNCLIFKF